MYKYYTAIKHVKKITELKRQGKKHTYAILYRISFIQWAFIKYFPQNELDAKYENKYAPHVHSQSLVELTGNIYKNHTNNYTLICM